jgi:hypothetical protein
VDTYHKGGLTKPGPAGSGRGAIPPSAGLAGMRGTVGEGGSRERLRQPYVLRLLGRGAAWRITSPICSPLAPGYVSSHRGPRPI